MVLTLHWCASNTSENYLFNIMHQHAYTCCEIFTRSVVDVIVTMLFSYYFTTGAGVYYIVLCGCMSVREYDFSVIVLHYM